MNDIKRALESIYAVQNQQQATEESVGNIAEEPTGAQAAAANLDKDVEVKGSFNAKSFGALLGMDSSEAALLASFLNKHKNGMQPSRNEIVAAADVFRALVDAEPKVTNQAMMMLRRVSADTAESAYESFEDQVAQVVDESIRLTKEGVEECWGDMAAPAAPAQAGETMTVNISMPNKNISVTTDSADEIMNVLKLAGIAVGTAEPAVDEPTAPAVDAEPAMVGAPAMPADHDADHELVKSLDKDGDGDHDQADHDAEKGDDEKKDDKAIMGAKEVKEEDIDENAFNQAAAAAARQGKEEFEFPAGSGKMHPVKMDKTAAHQMGESEQTVEEDAQAEARRILGLAGLDETKLANSPAGTSMDEPHEFDSLPSEKGTGGGKPDYGTRQSNMGGENPMALHSLDMEESFQRAMGEYRKFVAENISKK